MRASFFSKLSLSFCIPVILLASLGCPSLPSNGDTDEKLEHKEQHPRDAETQTVQFFAENITPADLSEYGLNAKWSLDLRENVKSQDKFRRFDALRNRLIIESPEARVFHVNIDSGDLLGITRLKDVITAPPTADNENIYLHTFRSLLVISAQSGNIKRRLPLSIPLNIRPLPFNGSLIAGSATGAIVKLDIDSGAPLWTNTVYGGALEPIAFDNNILAITSNRRLIVVDPDNGRVVRYWQPRTPTPISSGPAINKGKIFLGMQDGFLKCLAAKPDVKTLDIEWRFPTGSAITAPPVFLDEDLLLITTRGAESILIRLTPEPQEIWSHTDSKKFIGAGERGLYFISTDNALLRLDPTSGEEEMRIPLTEEIIAISGNGNNFTISLASPKGVVVGIDESPM